MLSPISRSNIEQNHIQDNEPAKKVAKTTFTSNPLLLEFVYWRIWQPILNGINTRAQKQTVPIILPVEPRRPSCAVVAMMDLDFILFFYWITFDSNQDYSCKLILPKYIVEAELSVLFLPKMDLPTITILAQSLSVTPP